MQGETEPQRPLEWSPLLYAHTPSEHHKQDKTKPSHAPYEPRFSLPRSGPGPASGPSEAGTPRSAVPPAIHRARTSLRPGRLSSLGGPALPPSGDSKAVGGVRKAIRWFHGITRS